MSADLDTIAAEAMASLNTDSSKETTDELPTVQETYDTDTYVTNETYFGSADNMTYSIPDPAPKTEESAEDDFAAGISGVDPTANGTIPQAPGELFTAPSEFDNVPAADDEFAVTKPEDPAGGRSDVRYQSLHRQRTVRCRCYADRLQDNRIFPILSGL